MVLWLDNASTYKPLLDFYESCPYEVVRLPKNHGHTAPWTFLADVFATGPYVVTDPDLDLSEVPAWSHQKGLICSVLPRLCSLPHSIR